MATTRKKAGPKSVTAKAAKATKTIQFVLDDTTKGAVKYAEVDSKGNKVDTSRGSSANPATYGMIYLRKPYLGCGDSDAPKTITVVVPV